MYSTNKTFKKSHCTQNKAQIAQLEECKTKNKTKRNKNQTCTAQIRVSNKVQINTRLCEPVLIWKNVKSKDTSSKDSKQ